MTQPQQTFTQWAKTYNSRQNHSKQADFFGDGFLWKFVVLAGLSYLVWTDKFSVSFSLNDQQITGNAVKTSVLSILEDDVKALPNLKISGSFTAKHPKNALASASEKSKVQPDVIREPDSEKAARMNTYVSRFASVAIAEMHKFGIPASVILAQGLLESNAGSSGLAKQANNHFGMKCFSKNCKKGHCINYSDDTHKDFFIKYPNAWGSFRQHSEMLKSKPRYADLFQSSDYRQWAEGLSKAGYATDKQYGTKLIALIQSLRLDQYDKQ